MNLKMMEGLIGAGINGNLMDTPISVFQEASRKGDTATMERAMGYAGELADKAEKYRAEVDNGMKEEAQEVKEKSKLEREEAIQKHRQEREKLEERIEENRSTDINTDTVEISEEGKALLKDKIDLDNTSSDEIKTDTVKDPVTYTKTGEVVPMEQSADISVSV